MQSATIQKTDEKWLWKPCFVMAAIVGIMILNFVANHFFLIRFLITSAGCNAIAFLAGYVSLKRFETLVFWKFAVYLGTLFGINWFFKMTTEWAWSLLLMGDCVWFSHWFLPLFAVIALNIGFLKYLFQIDTRTAIPMGILMGMTNAQVSSIHLFF